MPRGTTREEIRKEHEVRGMVAKISEAAAQAAVAAGVLPDGDIDNAIDAVILVEVDSGGVIDTAIDDAIGFQDIDAQAKAAIDEEILPGGSIDVAIDNVIATEILDGGVIDNAIDALIPAPRVYVVALSSTSVAALTSTSTKALLFEGTLDAGAYSASFDLYDSGTGKHDSLRYQDNDGLGTIVVDVTCSFNIKHVNSDGRQLDFRALSYLVDATQNGGHIYGSVGNNGGSISTFERTVRMTLTDGDYINYRAAFVNSAAGSGGALLVMGSYTDSGSTNITSSAATLAFDTSEEADSNLTLNVDGSISIAVAGEYCVAWSVPVNDDGLGGLPRGAVKGFCQYDVNDDGADYVLIPQTRGQDYARETSDGQGINGGGTFTAAAGSRIRLRVSVTSSVDISAETGEASLSIFRIPKADMGSESGRIESFGFQLVVRQAE